MHGSTTLGPSLLVKHPKAVGSLATSERKAWRLTASGEIPSVGIGRSVRYAPEDLKAWIEAQKNGGDA